MSIRNCMRLEKHNTDFGWQALTIACLIVAPLASFAQDISTSTLTWEAVESTDLEKSTTLAMKCSFRTESNSSVEWIQKKGQLRNVFVVTSVEGTWNDISSVGTITYTLSRNGKSYKMKLEKDDSGTFITMDFSKDGEYQSRYRFRITSVQ